MGGGSTKKCRVKNRRMENYTRISNVERTGLCASGHDPPRIYNRDSSFMGTPGDT